MPALARKLSTTTALTAANNNSYLRLITSNILSEKRVHGAVTLTTIYGYDAGGGLASVTYPSGGQIVYAYDAAGRVSSVTESLARLVSGVTYQPVGMASGWTAGNGHLVGTQHGKCPRPPFRIKVRKKLSPECSRI